MKKVLLIIGAVLLVVLIGAGIYLNPLLPIITGYTAKGLASGVFLSEREQEDIEAVDLNFSFIKYTKNHVNHENKTVTSRFLWHKSKVVYDEDYGCTIVRDFTKEKILDRPPLLYESTTDLREDISWPAGDKIDNSYIEGVDYTLLSEAVDNAFGDEAPHLGTRALLIVYKDKLVAEHYADGFYSGSRLLSWSMGKSVTNALIGILSKQDKLDINDPILMPGWADDDRAPITWADMMHMSSGLEWEEDYGNESDVNVMLHKVGDFGKFTAEKPSVAPVNTVWNYSSGSTNLVCLKMKDLFETDAEYYNFPYTFLFQKLGMNSVVFETDASGTYVGSSYIYATARDFTRFGMLYLNDGNWLGEQILPEGWVNYTTTEAEASNGVYGSYFWLNRSGEKLPDAPGDTYFCQGHDGQWIIMVPSKDLVVVRLGYSDKVEFSNNLMMKDILEAFPE
ncbi:MAG: serine hydrolase [Candidatus Marinimicrobia bacterium]|nr:serine hydrolase [Candidatus Neomarinimicrobiota bacterium]